MKSALVIFILLLSTQVFSKTLDCNTNGISRFRAGIDVVTLEINKDSLKIIYRYENSDNEFSTLSDNTNPAFFHSYKENQIIFGFDGETFGKLASFDNGKSYQGRAVVSQDFDLFFDCK